MASQTIVVRPHLVAAAFTALVFTSVLVVGIAYARHYEDRYVASLGMRQLMQTHVARGRNRPRFGGVALHEAALRQPDLVLFYGSSELNHPNPFHAGELFRSYASGFDVFPVGQAGMTSLVVLQDAAAAGSEIRDKRIVISLSPAWFYQQPMAVPAYYDGNFSRLQAYALTFSTRIAYRVRRLAAKRMLRYPETLRDPFLELALRTLASSRFGDRALYIALWPLGKLEEGVLRLQDHWETVHLIGGISGLSSHPARVPFPLDWPALLEAAEQEQPAWNAGHGRPFQSPLEQANLGQSAEWTDLELLLSGLKDLGAHPLLLSMPIAAWFYEQHGMPQPARETLYYDRLRNLAARFGVRLIDFEGYEQDPGFLDGASAHLSTMGWVYYDEAIDRFYHGQLD